MIANAKPMTTNAEPMTDSPANPKLQGGNHD